MNVIRVYKCEWKLVCIPTYFKPVSLFSIPYRSSTIVDQYTRMHAYTCTVLVLPVHVCKFLWLPIFELETIQRRIIPPIRYIFHDRSTSLLCWLNLSLLKKKWWRGRNQTGSITKMNVRQYFFVHVWKTKDWMCIIVYTSGMFKAIAKTDKTSIHAGSQIRTCVYARAARAQRVFESTTCLLEMNVCRSCRSRFSWPLYEIMVKTCRSSPTLYRHR